MTLNINLGFAGLVDTHANHSADKTYAIYIGDTVLAGDEVSRGRRKGGGANFIPLSLLPLFSLFLSYFISLLCLSPLLLSPSLYSLFLSPFSLLSSSLLLSLFPLSTSPLSLSLPLLPSLSFLPSALLPSYRTHQRLS